MDFRLILDGKATAHDLEELNARKNMSFEINDGEVVGIIYGSGETVRK